MRILGAQNLAWDEKSVRILSLLNAYGQIRKLYHISTALICKRLKYSRIN